MYAEVVWVLVSLGTHVQPQIILDPDYLPDCLSVSYDYVKMKLMVALKISLLVELSLTFQIRVV